MKTIKAAGRSPRESVDLAKVYADHGENELEVLLDDPTSANDVRRFLESRNYAVRLEDDDGTVKLSARRKDAPAPAPLRQEQTPKAQAQVPQTQVSQEPDRKRTFSVMITCLSLGQGELGEALMKSLLSTLTQAGKVASLALVNEGVKLALYDSSSCDHLKNLERQGIPILISGTCVNYFQIADRIGAGTISSMPEMLEILNEADKVMTL